MSAASCGSEYARLAAVSINAVVPVLLFGVDAEDKLVDGATGAPTLFAGIAVRTTRKRKNILRIGALGES